MYYEIFGINVLDPLFLIVPPIGATLMTLIAKMGRDNKRLHGYRMLAARYAGFKPEIYWEKLYGDEDWGEMVLRGINNHEEELISRGESLLLSIGWVDSENLKSASVELENRLNEFFFACYMQNRRDLPMIRKQLRWMRQRFAGMVLNDPHFDAYFKQQYQTWLEELWDWEETMIMLEPHFNKPPARLDL
jgi:hypothetical protein